MTSFFSSNRRQIIQLATLAFEILTRSGLTFFLYWSRCLRPFMCISLALGSLNLHSHNLQLKLVTFPSAFLISSMQSKPTGWITFSSGWRKKNGLFFSFVKTQNFLPIEEYSFDHQLTMSLKRTCLTYRSVCSNYQVLVDCWIFLKCCFHYLPNLTCLHSRSPG